MTAWSNVVPDGGVAFADLAKFDTATMPMLTVKRRMEKERIRAAPLSGRVKTLASSTHPASDELFQAQVYKILETSTCDYLLRILAQMNQFWITPFRIEQESLESSQVLMLIYLPKYDQP